MMICQRVQVKDFRNIEEAAVAFDPSVNILIGANAQGKTNLLEAIAFASIGKSFRSSHDEDMIRFGAELSEVKLQFSSGGRDQSIVLRMMAGKRKHIELNRVKVSKVSDLVGAFRSVLFCPEHLSLVKDGPAERRNYLDIAISQLYPVYLKSLQRYHQVLKQRNQLIRDAEEDKKTFRDTIEFWSLQLAEESAVIASYRYKYLSRASGFIRQCFAEMTGDKEIPSAVYVGSSHLEPEEYLDLEKSKQSYRDLLLSHHDREIAAGSTLWGIHKDDIDLRLNDKPARQFASQGQQRSLALALKLAEGDVSASVCGEKPVFLFDDVFSELDAARRAYLSTRMTDRQVIMTTCEDSEHLGGNKIYVENGVYTEAK